MATLQSIQAKIARLQAQAEAIATAKSTVVLDKIRELMEKHQISVTDVETHIGKRRGRKSANKAGAGASKAGSAAKYRDPKTGATWTGHGRAPQWIANAKNRARFLIDGASSGTAAAARKPAKAGNYVRGPQAPKYRDPKTGATWSGRGRAPAWLASVKDRTRFLIDGAADSQSAPVKKKAASAKKAARANGATPAKKATRAKRASSTGKAVSAKRSAAARKVSARKPAANTGGAVETASSAVAASE
jgi:DNA-binding protein H-NS